MFLHIYARCLCSRARSALKAGGQARATIGYFVYKATVDLLALGMMEIIGSLQDAYIQDTILSFAMLIISALKLIHDYAIERILHTK